MANAISTALPNKFLIVGSFLLSSLLSVAAIADSGSAGRYIHKFRVQGVMTSIKKKDPPTVNMFNPEAASNPTKPTYVTSSVSSNTRMGSGAGVTASSTYFINDHMAIEASLGFYRKKIKTSGVGPQYYTDANGVTSILQQPFDQSTMVSFIPVTLLAQYHIAPYGKISPYVGAGLHYTAATGSQGSSIGSARGIVIQAGFDTWINDNMLVNFDVKKYASMHKVRYVSTSQRQTTTSGASFSNLVPISTKIDINPLLLSLGVGYRF